MVFEGLEDRQLLTVQALSLADANDAVGGGFALGGLSALSADGRYTIFLSAAANVVAGQTDVNNNALGDNKDLFLFDRDNDSVTLVSHAHGAPLTTGNREVHSGLISADGQYIVLTTNATDMLPGILDTNGTIDAYLYEMATGNVTLITHASGAPTTAGDGPSFATSISADGAYVAFSSGAKDLVAGQTGGNIDSDVFLWERSSGAVTLVSHIPGSLATTGNSESAAPFISGDGEFVVFYSSATNLVNGQIDASSTTIDYFLYERASGALTLVSHAADSPVTTGNGQNVSVEISGDGAFVAFSSTATNLVEEQVDNDPLSVDIFLFDRSTNGVTLVSHAAGLPATAVGAAGALSINEDGQRVAFDSSASNLMAGPVDTGGTQNVFVYDHSNGAMILVTHAAGAPDTAGNGYSRTPVISADGLSIALFSNATNLVAGQADINGVLDLFLYSGGDLTLASHAAGLPATAGNGEVLTARLSGNGQFIAYTSYATNLVAGALDTDPISTDMFLYDHAAAANLLLSRRDTSTQQSLTANDDSETQVEGPTSTSADGRYTVFVSNATNLVAGSDTNGNSDVFLLDRVTGARTLVSHQRFSLTTAGNAESLAPVISADGRFIVFASRATNLAAGVSDFNGDADIFLYDRTDGSLTLVSHNNSLFMVTTGDSGSFNPLISADGQFIVFESNASNLVPNQNETNFASDLFLYERATGALSLVSHASYSLTTTGDSASTNASISADGQFIVFESFAGDLVSGQDDTNFNADIFLFDRLTPFSIALVSHISASATTTGNVASANAAISADGQFVAFESSATDLIAGVTDGNSVKDIFLYEGSSTLLSLVSHVAGDETTSGGGESLSPAMNSDGQFLTYISVATNLVAGMTDANGTGSDVFLYDRAADSTTLVSHQAGFATVTSDDTSQQTVISADGRWVAFSSSGTNLAAGQVDTNGSTDVFLFDRTSGAVRLASHISGSLATTGDDSSREMLISADGRFVFFESDAENLLAGDLNLASDVFLFALNFAPVLDSSGSPSLPVIIANQVNPFGSSVASIVGSSITDPDAAALEGIAVTGLSGASVGTWEYSINGGIAWNSFPAVAESLALLLRATDLVRYRPGASYDGSANISYHAWDQTIGTTGSTPDLSGAGATGDTAAFSAAVETAVVTELVQLVLRGSLLTVLGTSGADTFSFTAGATHSVVLNSTSYDFDPLLVTTYHFDSQGGNDQATLTGDDGVDDLVLFPTSGILDGQGYLVTLTGTKEIVGHGGLNDAAYLYDSSDADTFLSVATSSLMTDDTPTPDPDYSYLNQANGFGLVNGVFTAGGSDQAYLYDTATDDTFVAQSTISSFYGGTSVRNAIQSDFVTGVANGGGTDTAYLYGTADQDTFVGIQALSILTGNGFGYNAIGFDSVTGVSGGGTSDVAHLHDTSGNDIVVLQPGSGPDSSYVSGSGVFYQVLGFRTVNAYSQTGGADAVNMVASAGDDAFVGQDTEAYLSSTDYDLFAYDYELVRAIDSDAGADTTEINSLDYVFEEIGDWD